jgi:hypothetical protein
MRRHAVQPAAGRSGRGSGHGGMFGGAGAAIGGPCNAGVRHCKIRSCGARGSLSAPTAGRRYRARVRGGPRCEAIAQRSPPARGPVADVPPAARWGRSEVSSARRIVGGAARVGDHFGALACDSAATTGATSATKAGRGRAQGRSRGRPRNIPPRKSADPQAVQCLYRHCKGREAPGRSRERRAALGALAGGVK